MNWLDLGYDPLIISQSLFQNKLNAHVNETGRAIRENNAWIKATTNNVLSNESDFKKGKAMT